MSLLSQINKRVLETEPKVVSDEPSILEREVEDPNKSDPDVLAHKKKKRRNEDAKQVEVEQEKEMQRLENVLFGSLYSPIEFGKDDKEEDEPQSQDGGELPLGAFLDRRAYNVVAPGEDEEILDESATGLVPYVGEKDQEIEGRKPAWVDEEDEKAKINIAKVNRLRKLRKEEDETVISGSAYEVPAAEDQAPEGHMARYARDAMFADLDPGPFSCPSQIPTRCVHRKKKGQAHGGVGGNRNIRQSQGSSLYQQHLKCSIEANQAMMSMWLAEATSEQSRRQTNQWTKI